MIPEDVVTRRQCYALVDGNLFSSWIISDAHIKDARLKIIDAVGSVARILGNSERCSTIGDALFDEFVGQR